MNGKSVDQEEIPGSTERIKTGRSQDRRATSTEGRDKREGGVETIKRRDRVLRSRF